MATIDIDEDDEIADWLKANCPFPRTIEEFRKELIYIEITPEEFKKLPVYRMKVKEFPTCPTYSWPQGIFAWNLFRSLAGYSFFWTAAHASMASTMS